MLKKHFLTATGLAFIAYMLVLIKLILLKNPQSFISHLHSTEASNIQQGEAHLVLIPFHTTWSCLSGQRTVWEAIENIGGNLFGFVPMGIMLPLLFSRMGSAKKVIAAIFLVSLCFELTQFFTGVGYCDIDDLIQNTLGGAVGFWVYRKWLKSNYSIKTNAAQE